MQHYGGRGGAGRGGVGGASIMKATFLNRIFPSVISCFPDVRLISPLIFFLFVQ